MKIGLFILIWMMISNLAIADIAMISDFAKANNVLLNGEQIELQKGLALNPQDSLKIDDCSNENEAFISLIDGKTALYITCEQNNPYIVEGEITVPSTFQNIFNMANSWIAKLIINSDYEGSALSKGGPKSKIMERSYDYQLQSVHLSSIQKEFHLTWQYGKPPYDIYICQRYCGENPQTKAIAHATVNIQEALFSKIDFVLNKKYQVLIQDQERSNDFKEKFIVVSDDDVPNAAFEIISQNSEEIDRYIMLATYFASHGRQLEAYQQISTIKKHNKLSALVKKRIGQGVAPFNSIE
ncbi:hypothetical protein [Candidatus Albibeggiatoa sp. nov. NOAA]|uniref:hypothetical protein n=1 Tax=Candidatus Albibeggiatoa sp. nov. NOAA TaxID=3162724 RepID=UPI0032F3D65D|nr:hypothetical protein [Thiotrichaceae bacterium]